MSSMVAPLIAHVLALQVKLYACQARLLDNTDTEALHDLRTSVRRLRSLLRPLRGLPGAEPAELAARAVGQLTTPYRDREVLAAHLREHGHEGLARTRERAMQGVFQRVGRSPQVAQLLRSIDGLPGFLRAAQRAGLLAGLGKRIGKRLGKQQGKLLAAIDDPAHDRHRLRLLIKRVRYAAEAYPELNQLPPGTIKQLKRAQGALGDWHDHHQWLLQAEQETDLQPCVRQWRESYQHAETRADQVLEKLKAAVHRGKAVPGR
jgi:CHAD domain-containing protein